MTKEVGYLGPPGSFGEQAALLYDHDAVLRPYPTHLAIVQAVQAAELAEGVTPVENSLEGAINETLDALIQADGVFMRRELVLAVEQNLVAAPGTRLEDVRVVMSHPAALAQCRAYLQAHLPRARIEAALSTAAAVVTAVKTPGTAGIGTRRAAELAGGVIIGESIQDVQLNKTRFVVIGREDAAATGDDKTSIAFTVAHDRPGTLIGVLQELSQRSINLTHIESRPSREDLGIYVFLIDFQGHRDDPTVASAIESVRRQASTFRLLGSYPRFVETS